MTLLAVAEEGVLALASDLALILKLPIAVTAPLAGGGDPGGGTTGDDNLRDGRDGVAVTYFGILDPSCFVLDAVEEATDGGRGGSCPGSGSRSGPGPGSGSRSGSGSGSGKGLRGGAEFAKSGKLGTAVTEEGRGGRGGVFISEDGRGGDSSISG